MSTYYERIEKQVREWPKGLPIIASRMYESKVQGIPQVTFYKALERLTKRGKLVRIGKGLYSPVKETRFGKVVLSEKEIVEFLIANYSGVVIGYPLYTRLGLTTQVAKTIEVLSTQFSEVQRSIGRIHVYGIREPLAELTIKHIEALEVLEAYNEIEDLNKKTFSEYIKQIADFYDEQACEKALVTRKYKKRTIAFLRMILNHYGVANTLGRHLSPLTKYDIPQESALYGAA
jgi:hypothetical protein